MDAILSLSLYVFTLFRIYLHSHLHFLVLGEEESVLMTILKCNVSHSTSVHSCLLLTLRGLLRFGGLRGMPKSFKNCDSKRAKTCGSTLLVTSTRLSGNQNQKRKANTFTYQFVVKKKSMGQTSHYNVIRKQITKLFEVKIILYSIHHTTNPHRI